MTQENRFSPQSEFKLGFKVGELSINCLATLYAQSDRTTLVPPVLPRLLARGLPGLFSPDNVTFFSGDRALRPQSNYGLYSPWRHRWVRLAPIAQDSPLQP